MAAAEISETAVGGLVGNPSNSGKGLVEGVYEFTKVTQNDWVIFGDFATIEFVQAATVSAGAYTAEACTVDGTTKNKVTFTSATTGTVKVKVTGTPA